MDAKTAGKLIQEHRKKRSLTQEQVVDRSTVPNAQYLSALENGRYDVRNSEHFKSLVQVLNLTVDDVRELNPDAVIEVSTPAARGPIPPPYAPVDLPLEISPALQEVIDIHGDRYPELHDQAALRKLTRHHFFDGNEIETADQWLDFFLTVRRFLR